MFEHRKIQKLENFFLELNKRATNEVYFYRINTYNDQIKQFIQKYYEAARVSGVIIEGGIPNPDDKNLSYYNEMMGMDFQLDYNFIVERLRKWLPRMNEYQSKNVADAIYHSLCALKKKGKNENMLKNAYIKYMCWLYYKFERIVNILGEQKIPKILYEGNISNYELLLLSILSSAGCDIVLLQYQGDSQYLCWDPDSHMSDLLESVDSQPFPEDFSLKKVQQSIQDRLNRERIYGTKPSLQNCTNAWIEGNGLSDVLKSSVERGTDPNLYYNCFFQMNGVADKITYMNDLFQFYQNLHTASRKCIVVNERIPNPTVDEIAEIRRENYRNANELVMGLSANIQYSASIELQRIMVKAFIDIILEESEAEDMNLNKLRNKAIYLICWLKRYQTLLFSNWKPGEIACFIYMGACQTDGEALFLKMIARLPIDVINFIPDLNSKGCLQDKLLYEINYTTSLSVSKFPENTADIRVGTVAYHAERELDSLLYQDSGMYRDMQYHKITSLNLQTMYEEIRLLWNEEVKYRPNFSTNNDIVNIPVIYAKICGVKDGNTMQYWQSIKELVGEDTVFIQSVPWIDSGQPNILKQYSTEFFRNGKVQKNKIKEHKNYLYGVLREETQDLIFEKLQLLIDEKLIRGTYENGTEYTIVATILNLPKDIVRMIQKFDFTKKNPKVVYVNTTEKMISLEDTIITTFLNLIGFDIIFFVPTGYQTIEKHLNRVLMEEHQIGEYLYDLTVPNLATLPVAGKLKSWRNKIFKRGKSNGN